MGVVVYTFVDDSISGFVEGSRSTMSLCDAHRERRFNGASAISYVGFSIDSYFTYSMTMTQLESTMYIQL